MSQCDTKKSNNREMFHFGTKYYQWFITTRYTNIKAVNTKNDIKL